MATVGPAITAEGLNAQAQQLARVIDQWAFDAARWHAGIVKLGAAGGPGRGGVLRRARVVAGGSGRRRPGG